MVGFLPGVFALAAKAAGAASAASSAYSSLTGTGSPNKTDLNSRKPKAEASLRAALAGSLSSAQEILRLRFNSATPYGRSVYEQAWQQLQQQNPGIATEALKTHREVVAQDKPSVRDQLGDELERLWKNLRVEAGDTAQRVLTGSGPAAKDAIAGYDDGTASLIPGISKNQLMYAGLALLLLVAALWWFRRK